MDEAPSTAVPHEIRITTHGKMNTWVAFALKFFQEHPELPLVLHTMPVKTTKLRTAALPNSEGMDAAEKTREPEIGPMRTNKQPRMPSSMALIPRLVSVVEIIKREYLKGLDTNLAHAGCLSGLHQYNEVRDLHEDNAGGEEVNEEARVNNLVATLQGKNHLQQKKIAFMKVTLCCGEMPDLVAGGTTYQKPNIRRLSKSARTRLKRKLGKGTDADGGE